MTRFQIPFATSVLAAGLLAVAVMTLAIAPASGATLTLEVTKTADTNDGTCNADCSLREAVIAANNAGTPVTIHLPAGTYTLTIPGTHESTAATGDLDLTASMTIEGDGAEHSIVDGGGIDTVFDIFDPAVVTVQDLTVQGGSSGNGGIYTDATTTLDSVIVKDNTGTLNGVGGVNSHKDLTIRNSKILNNQIDGGDYGTGGLYASGTLLMENSVVSENTVHGGRGTVGGVWLSDGDFTINGSDVTYNQATASDQSPTGGMYARDATLHLNDSNVVDNTGDGLYVVTMGEPKPFFALVAREGAEIALVQNDDPQPSGCYVYVTEVDALHDTLAAAGVYIDIGLQTQPWCNRDFVVQDPDGHHIAFGESGAGS